MYDKSKLTDALDIVEDLKTAVDHLRAAQEILERHEILNQNMSQDLKYIVTFVRNDVLDRAEQLTMA
jgi:hypothetical protein